VTAYNVVRMRVKPGRNEDYLEAHRAIDRDTFPGMRSVVIIQTVSVSLASVPGRPDPHSDGPVSVAGAARRLVAV
jgi:hypothetical protein